MEQVNNQIATLRANVATYVSRKATLALAQANLKRGEELVSNGGISKEDFDVRRQTVKVDEAAVGSQGIAHRLCGMNDVPPVVSNR